MTFAEIQSAVSRLLPRGGSSAIVRAAAVVATMTVAVKLVAFVKEILISAQFGRSDAIDAFLVAFLLPSFALNVIAGGFHAGMIPTFIAVRHKHGQARAQRLLSNTACICIALLAVTSALLALFADTLLPLLSSGFSPEKLALTETLFFWLLPCLTIKGIASIWADTLNADNKFGLASIAPALQSVAVIIALLSSGHVFGVFALAVGFVVGSVLEAVVLAIAVRRDGWRIMPKWSGMNADMAAVLRQYWPAVAAGVLMSGTSLIDGAMAAMLEAGSVAALNYGVKISALALGIGATALSVAALPHLSMLVSQGRLGEMRHVLIRFQLAIFAIAIPLSALLIAYSHEIIAIVYQRGAFTASDTELVAQVQAAFFLQIPFYVASGFAVRFVQAMKANRIMLIGTAISLVLNVVLNYVLMQYYGVIGIALSTSLVYVCSFLFLTYCALRLMAQQQHGGDSGDYQVITERAN